MNDWNQNNALNRLKQRLKEYFSRPDRYQTQGLANETKLRKYVWIMRSLFLDPDNSADIFSLILNLASNAVTITDYHMECMFRYYFGKMMNDLYQSHYFALRGKMAKRSIFNSSSAVNIRIILEALRGHGMGIGQQNPTNLERLPAKMEYTFGQILSVNPQFNHIALEPYIILNAQEYNSAIRQSTITKLANKHNLPPNIPEHIKSFELEAPVDFMQRRINPNYVDAFIDRVFAET